MAAFSDPEVMAALQDGMILHSQSPHSLHSTCPGELLDGRTFLLNTSFWKVVSLDVE
jgi:hypothetical protein